MKEISIKALAKINLGLDVVRRREDGYHEVRMIMQTIHLFDRLQIMRNRSGKITMSANLSFLPKNENNLVYKAAKLLKDEFLIRDGIHVKLYKHIPVAAGMAGGSTDAAAVLYGLNRMFGLGLSKEELMQRGDAKRRKAWRGRTLLCDAGDGACRRYRRKAYGAAADGKVSGADRKAADWRFYEIRV